MQEFYNKEIGQIETFFLNQFGEIKKFSELKNYVLNEKVYYKPSMFPYISKITTEGSVIDKHNIPSAQYTFIKNNYKLLKQNLKLNTYVEQAYFLIDECIKNLLEQNDKIILCFSGGIDSIVLLSFFEKFNALDKIQIVNYENYFIENHPDLVRNNPVKKSALSEIQKSLKKNFIKLKITNEDWLYCLNVGSYTDTKAYCLSTVMKHFPEYCIVSGYFGDKTLFHDKIWLDQILFHKPDKKNLLKNYLKNTNLYMNNFFVYDFDKEFVNLENYTFHMRTFSTFGSRLWMPLSIPLRLSRQLDISTIDLVDILDAKVAREIIYKNVGKKYNDFITHTGNLDGDAYAKKTFKKSQIMKNVLDIPKNLNHNKQGFYWLSNLLKEDLIETNTLTSVKMLNFLNKILESSK